MSSCLKTPVFLGHGTADEKVKVDHGKDAATALERLGMDVTWVAYQDFYHWYKEPDEIDDTVTFFRDKMSLESNQGQVGSVALLELRSMRCDEEVISLQKPDAVPLAKSLICKRRFL